MPFSDTFVFINRMFLPVFILLQLSIYFVSADFCFSYGNTSVPCVKLCFDSHNLTLTSKHFNLTVPSNAAVKGICSKIVNGKQNFSTLELTWSESGASDWLEFYFILNTRSTGQMEIGAKHDWYLSNVTYTRKDISSHSNRTYRSPSSFLGIITSDVFSYECNKFSVNLTDNSTTNNYVILSMSNYIVQAFDLFNNGTFSDPDHCLGPGFPFYVPLSIGCALLVLVSVPFVVHLVYYFFNKYYKFGIGKDDGPVYRRLESETN